MPGSGFVTVICNRELPKPLEKMMHVKITRPTGNRNLSNGFVVYI
jgi:hypothetical protein